MRRKKNVLEVYKCSLKGKTPFAKDKRLATLRKVDCKKSHRSRKLSCEVDTCVSAVKSCLGQERMRLTKPRK